MQVYSLFDLNEHIRRVIALNYPQALWLTAEIAQCGQSRGHFYFDLVQKGGDNEPVAQAQAVLWAGDYRRLLKHLGPDIDNILRDGLEIKMQVRVDFHERYGMKLIIADLDPAWTFGQLEIQRRQTIQTLRELGLLDRNRALPLPPVLQRVAVVSSEGAAGFRDFQEHLANNTFGYRFECQLFASSVQGKNAEAELCEALQRVAARHVEFDCCVVVRGGGARLDLAAFDGLELCKTVAAMPLPVFSGIGHDVDEPMLDLVAHSALKTPTAVADFLLHHNLFFENEVFRLAADIRVVADYRFRVNQIELERLESSVHWSARERLGAAARNLDALEENVPGLAFRLLQNHNRRLDQFESVCLAFHPENVLRRGYSLTKKNGKVVTSPAEVETGDVLETQLKSGVIRSKAQ